MFHGEDGGDGRADTLGAVPVKTEADMMQQGFWIRKNVPLPWWFMVYYGVRTESDRQRVYGALLASGAGADRAGEAVSVLRKPDTAYIFSDTRGRASIIALSHVTSRMQFLNSVTHELQHATSTVCGTYGIPYDGEDAAYIQGEIGEKLYAGVALSICPKCNCGKQHYK